MKWLLTNLMFFGQKYWKFIYSMKMHGYSIFQVVKIVTIAYIFYITQIAYSYAMLNERGRERRKKERLGSIFVQAVRDGKSFLVEEASPINPLSELMP